ncbi:MAG TPA: nitroreductase family protein [Actinomycetota bacterium]|nr:nitroreductase family protein [Actinomycetota bacterium]
MTAYRPVPAPRHDLSAEQALEASRLFRATMATRRSIRDFSEEPFDLELIRNALVVANSAPSGANVQPWHFVVVTDREVKRRIREEAEREEKEFYASKASMAWLAALEPLGTDYRKPHLEKAPVVIVVFEVHRSDVTPQPYYVKESVGIAAGFLLTALHHSGLATLTHTPSPMRFLNKILDRPSYERPYVVIPVGRAAPHAVVPDITKKEASEVTTWIPNSTAGHDVSD